MVSAGGGPGFRESGRDGTDEGAPQAATGSGSVAATPPAEPVGATFELIVGDDANQWNVPAGDDRPPMAYTRNEQGHLRVGDRTYPCYVDLADVYGPDGKLLHRVRRALVRLESGWGVSCIWGDATYSSNARAIAGTSDWGREFTEMPTCVEVGVLDHEGGLVDDPWSMQDVDDVNTLIDELATTPTRAEWMGKRRP